ncbi:hypothetical protein AMTRI_Chr09g22540 [Amborella trichopoda]
MGIRSNFNLNCTFIRNALDSLQQENLIQNMHFAHQINEIHNEKNREFLTFSISNNSNTAVYQTGFPTFKLPSFTFLLDSRKICSSYFPRATAKKIIKRTLKDFEHAPFFEFGKHVLLVNFFQVFYQIKFENVIYSHS